MSSSSSSSSSNPSDNYGPDLEEEKEHDGSANYSDARRHGGWHRHGGKFPLPPPPHCLHKTPLLYSTASSPNPSHNYGYGSDLEEEKEHDGSVNSDDRRHGGKRRRIDESVVLSRLHVRREKESDNADLNNEMEKFALSPRLRHVRNLKLANTERNYGLLEMEKFVFGGGGFGGGGLQQFKEEETHTTKDEDEDSQEGEDVFKYILGIFLNSSSNAQKETRRKAFCKKKQE